MFGTEWVLGSFLSKSFALTIALNFYNKNDNRAEKYLYLDIIMLILVYITIAFTFERANFHIFKFVYFFVVNIY